MLCEVVSHTFAVADLSFCYTYSDAIFHKERVPQFQRSPQRPNHRTRSIVRKQGTLHDGTPAFHNIDQQASVIVRYCDIIHAKESFGENGAVGNVVRSESAGEAAILEVNVHPDLRRWLEDLVASSYGWSIVGVVDNVNGGSTVAGCVDSRAALLCGAMCEFHRRIMNHKNILLFTFQ